jgi:alpha-maltose-1-phosphate synthase
VKPSNQIILSHSGKQHSYHVAKALNSLGYLDRYYTSSYVTNTFLQKYFLKNNNQFWTKRFLDGLDVAKVDANWRFEVKENVARLLKKNSFTVEKLVYERDVKFDEYIAGKIQKINSPVFWGFQGSCKNSLISAKNKKGLAICELATAHVTYAKKILTEEQKLNPNWADSISNVIFPKEYEKRLEEEPIEADIVIAASSFTKQSLTESGIDKNKIRILPLGASVEHINYIPGKSKTDRPLKLLYAGTVTQRKGIYYLLEAMKTFSKKDVELHIIGNVFGSGNEFAKYTDHYNYHGAVSQQNLFQQYAEYDALVLPTIFEGFALVIVEAMAAGLPVITTAHSIGPDLIINDKNGYIVPIRDIGSIKKAINSFLNKSEPEWLEMQFNARASALNYSWKNYTIRLNDLLTSL